MPIVNTDVAAVFNEIADLLEVQGANLFRVRAYRNAARMLSEFGRSVKILVDQGEDLVRRPSIGLDLTGKFREIEATSSCTQLERLRKELLPAITELLKISGLGPKRVRALHQELGIQTLEQLHRAAALGQVRGVHGFGPKTEQSILQATAARLRDVAIASSWSRTPRWPMCYWRNWRRCRACSRRSPLAACGVIGKLWATWTCWSPRSAAAP
jgi:DNA polymerase (family 10)